MYSHRSRVLCDMRQQRDAEKFFWLPQGAFCSPPQSSSPIFLPTAAVTQKSARKLIEAVKVLLSFSRKHMQEIPGKPCASKQWQGIGASLSKPPHQEKAPPHSSSCCAPAVSAPVLAGERDEIPRGSALGSLKLWQSLAIKSDIFGEIVFITFLKILLLFWV